MSKGTDFFVYRAPQSNHFMMQLLEADESGMYVFADFDGLIFRYSSVKEEIYNVSDLPAEFTILPAIQEETLEDTSIEFHLNNVKKAVDKINNGDLRKVVLSRKKTVNTDLDVTKTIQSLASNYPNAMVFAFCTQNTGLWMGATPEQLLRCDGGKAYATSLAGTRLSTDVGAWGTKEKEEQQLVTDQIIDVFTEFGLSAIEATEPETKIAGPVAHLHAVVSGTLSSQHKPLALAKMLHPTPAVGGIPKRLSLDFIRENEDYQRQFYTGFFGFADENNCSLWVNLRCMQVFENRLVLYAGGG
jgi:isochorismate synthase